MQLSADSKRPNTLTSAHQLCGRNLHCPRRAARLIIVSFWCSVEGATLEMITGRGLGEIDECAHGSRVGSNDWMKHMSPVCAACLKSARSNVSEVRLVSNPIFATLPLSEGFTQSALFGVFYVIDFDLYRLFEPQCFVILFTQLQLQELKRWFASIGNDSFVDYVIQAEIDQ